MIQHSLQVPAEPLKQVLGDDEGLGRIVVSHQAFRRWNSELTWEIDQLLTRFSSFAVPGETTPPRLGR